MHFNANKVEAFFRDLLVTDCHIDDMRSRALEIMLDASRCSLPPNGTIRLFDSKLATATHYDVPAQDFAEMKAMIENGKPIMAIKHLRNLSNLGLKEAKDMVEDMKTRYNIVQPPFSPIQS